MNAHVKTLREMFAECANDRRMQEADALQAAIAALEAQGEEAIGMASSLPGIKDGFTHCVFNGAEVPPGTLLFLAPPSFPAMRAVVEAFMPIRALLIEAMTKVTNDRTLMTPEWLEWLLSAETALAHPEVKKLMGDA